MTNFKVRRADDDESEARTVMARSPQEAAEVWAREADENSGDYEIVKGEEAEVIVSDDDGEYWFTVFGETERVYWARES